MKQTLDFIKANTLALMCGVVAIIAMIALFVYPVPGMFAQLREQVEARKKTHDDIASLSTATRTLPNFDPAVPEAPPLTAFPNKPIIAEGQKAVGKMKDEASTTLSAVVKMNAMKPLVEGALPKPEALARTDFFNAYRVASAQTGENVDRGIIRSVLHGTLPPTAEEMTTLENSRSNEIRKNNLQTDARGMAQNQPQVDALIAEMKSKLGMEERVRRAENYLIYVTPGAVEIHPRMVSVGDVTTTDIFNAQFSLWLQTIVLDAIDDANKGAKNVLDAPIKHLMSLHVPLNIADPATTGGSIGFGGPPENSGAAATPAVDLKPDATVALTPSYARDPLGYASNSMYDSINVQMVLRIDATRLADSLAALSRNHLIKIRNVSFSAVDVGIAMSQGYYYSRDGATPMVEVNIDCDVLLLRDWLVHYMPDPVKTVFNAMANPAAAAAQ